LSRHIDTARSLLERGAHQNVLDLSWIDARAFDGVADRVCAQRLSLRIVERAPIGFADCSTRR
jgi:hypothetical protein